jgi:hypothetical protein
MESLVRATELSHLLTEMICRNNILGIGAWKYQEVHPINAVPATAFTSHFALSDIEMSYGHFWLTFSMITVLFLY